jgi:hypothetical protein
MVHQTVHNFEQQPKCFWAWPKNMFIKFFGCQVWPPKLSDRNLLGNEKKSIDGSTSIID